MNLSTVNKASLIGTGIKYGIPILAIGIGIIMGGLIGGLLVIFLPVILINNFFFVFILSGIIRLIVVIIFLPKLKEVRVQIPKPIFNLKNSNLYRWLYDILIREKRNKRKNNSNNKLIE